VKSKKPIGTVISAITSSIISVVLIDLGIVILEKEKYIGIIKIL